MRASSARPLAGLRLLVVEDEALVAMLLEGMLDDLGCAVVEWAATVPRALDVAGTAEIDGALLDVNLNGTRIDPVAEALAGRGVPFVFVTGYDRADAREERFAGVPVLIKPFRPADLERALREAILSRASARS